jgi:hypothetical protein
MLRTKEKLLGDSDGSLILGGYDTSRFNASTSLSIAMPNKENNTAIVALRAISIIGPIARGWSAPADSTDVFFRIEPMIPQIWLPLEACEVFEKAFGIRWDSELQFYIVDNTTHDSLLQANPTISFSIGASSRSKAYQNYTLPYSAFDLQLAPPLVNTTTYYFPLKRATDPSQYVLGRAFLQETYITVDYERGNFSLSQAYPVGGSGYIVPIYNTSLVPDNSASNNDAAGSKNRNLTPGAYSGIGVGVGIIVLVGMGLLVSWRKGWGFFRKKVASRDNFEKSELHGNAKPRLEAMEKERAELAGEVTVEAMEREMAELETVEPSHEAGGLASTTDSLDGIHELYGDSVRVGDLHWSQTQRRSTLQEEYS